jgi:carboxyl-terminal processing protease
MTYGAIEGMLDSLGDKGHTRFLTPEDVKTEQSTLEGKFEGIGAELSIRDSRPTIVAPLEGSPAEKAGIVAGDVIMAVDGQDTVDMSISKVVSLVRGPKGSTVVLTILHPGANSTVDISIVRDEIKVDAVSWHYLSSLGIAHLRVSQFSEGAADEMVAALQEIRQVGAQGIVLDVRDDPGGLVSQLVGIASQFLSEGSTVFIEEDSQGNRERQLAKPGGLATDIPIVVLTNQGSASAAEILAGAIQGNHRGELVGDTTFGTGTVLTSFDLSDGSQVLLGIAQWLTPSGQAIKGKGIKPDVIVKLPLLAKALTPNAESSLSDAEVLSSEDAQLRTAIQRLTGHKEELKPAAIGRAVSL